MNTLPTLPCFSNLGPSLVRGRAMKCAVMWAENKNTLADWNDGFKILNHADLPPVHPTGTLINVIWGKRLVRSSTKLGIIEEMWTVFTTLREHADAMFRNSRREDWHESNLLDREVGFFMKNSALRDSWKLNVIDSRCLILHQHFNLIW